jgi:predicted nucleic acid-binding protein
MPSTAEPAAPVFFDAGVLIGALLSGDARHEEARRLVERARCGEIAACTTASVLSEVYGALTWEGARPSHDPTEAAEAVRLLVEAPSAIRILDVGYEAALLALHLSAAHGLRARRVHDARHAAAALVAGVHLTYTYDLEDWRVFEADGLRIAGPESTLARLSAPVSQPS